MSIPTRDELIGRLKGVSLGGLVEQADAVEIMHAEIRRAVADELESLNARLNEPRQWPQTRGALLERDSRLGEEIDARLAALSASQGEAYQPPGGAMRAEQTEQPPVAQRTGASCAPSEPVHARSDLGQNLERAGSTPASGITEHDGPVAQLEEHPHSKQKREGSSPSGPAIDEINAHDPTSRPQSRGAAVLDGCKGRGTEASTGRQRGDLRGWTEGPGRDDKPTTGTDCGRVVRSYTDDDKPGAESQASVASDSERDEGREASSPCPPPALSEPEILERAAEILPRFFWSPETCEHIRADAAKLRAASAPKPVDVFVSLAEEIDQGYPGEERVEPLAELLRDWFGDLLQLTQQTQIGELPESWKHEFGKVLSAIRQRAQEASRGQLQAPRDLGELRLPHRARRRAVVHGRDDEHGRARSAFVGAHWLAPGGAKPAAHGGEDAHVGSHVDPGEAVAPSSAQEGGPVKPERIEELMKDNRAIAASGVRMTHQPIPLDEARHLLRCARAVAELEEWMHENRGVAAVMHGHVGSDTFACRMVFEPACTGPDLLTAAEAALARAKENPDAT